MALKLKISSSDFESLPDHFKNEYSQKGDDYILDVDGMEDTGALRRAKDHEVRNNRDLKTKLAEANSKIEELQKGNDSRVSELQTKYDTDTKQYAERVSGLENGMKRSSLDETAREIAGKISTSPAIMLPHIRSRLSADIIDGSVKISVIGIDGKIDEKATFDTLGQEFVANKDFSSIMRGNGSSGGAGGQKVGSGASKFQKNESVDPSKMSGKELAEWSQFQREQRNSSE